MTTEELHELWEKHDNDFIRFDRVAVKLSNRPDLHAFLLLDKLVPGTMDMVSAAEHDEIYLEVLPDELLAVATEEQLIDLHRCGVRFSRSKGALCMFV